MNTYSKGLLSEWYARCFLRLRGYKIIGTRYITGRKTGRAEIDIIAQKQDLIIFIEVKSHKTFTSAWASIPDSQVRRLRRSAETYLLRRRWHGGARFDVIFVRGFRIYWMRGAI